MLTFFNIFSLLRTLMFLSDVRNRSDAMILSGSSFLFQISVFPVLTPANSAASGFLLFYISANHLALILSGKWAFISFVMVKFFI